MNKEWSNLNKEAQAKLKKSTFKEGINTFLKLREDLFKEMLSLKEELNTDDFSAMPYMNADGYHNKSIAYSIWHIMRIEDIVVNTLIRNDEEILFKEDFNNKIKSPIITTGNELIKEEIREFSRKLDIDALYAYAYQVKETSDKWLRSISYDDLKRRFTDEDKERIKNLNVVSKSEAANWLIDYWCSKDVAGLIKMPLSRHWVMHVEAALRIRNKL
ncbi:MAG: phage head-tail adapter protein [Erysipelotrichaceae bacterium]|nr:phage head-tail adapter protein [Erysipelotrichaceae bacterium]